MEKLLKEMMENGLLVYRYSEGQQPRPKFVLCKVITPTNSDQTIDHDNGMNSSLMYFNSYEEAVDKARAIIGWEPSKTPSTHMTTHTWMAQLMYRHKAGPRFEDLGTIESVFYENAVAEAKKMAERYITEIVGEELVEGWDVRVRPCDKPE